jgi:hypothetical protein
MFKKFLFTSTLLLCALTVCWADGTFPVAGKVYTINRMKNASAFMYDNGATISTSAFDNSKACFWRFIPQTNANCFYIQNVVTGHYIQSTNIGLSALVPMGTSPVEFQIATDQTSGAATNGFYYMASTDQGTISNATDGTLGLNFGASGVCAYYIKTGRGNSYWEIKETTGTYDIHPFESVDSLTDTPSYIYLLYTTSLKALCSKDGAAALEDRTASKNEQWYFVGTGNNATGYLIASNLQKGYTLNLTDGKVTFSKTDTPTRWFVKQIENGAQTLYSFVPYAEKDSANATALTVDGASQFVIALCPSDFSKAVGVYNLPCGVQGNIYLTKASVQGQNVLKELSYSATAKPASYYTIYTADKATVEQGKTFDLSLTASATATSLNTYVYFDWNGDGVFEKDYTFSNVAKTAVSQSVEVPADAAIGKTRMRVRLTTNGLADAEDEVEGNTYDFIVNVAQATDLRTVSATPNDSLRGTVTLSDGGGNAVSGNTASCAYGDKFTASATAKGNALFVCWKDGNEILSTSASYGFTALQNRDLVAYFSPNTTDINTAIAKTEVCSFIYNLSTANKMLRVETEANVKAVLLFDCNGSLVARTTRKSLSVKGFPAGVYIVKVCTDKGNGSEKIAVN